ncbi:MAG: 3-deoxy-D-manno-octulosonic acid transferase [Rickettsiales bacterium]
MIYKIYQLISILLYPSIKLLLINRVRKGKEDPLRYKEKLGFYNTTRPKGKLIWFHAASIGEFNAILPIIKSISEKHPSINILLTTVTLTAANIAVNNLPSNAIHQFAPFDCSNIINRFIGYWQPDLTIWTESEFWPNMIRAAENRGPLLLINARLSEKSFLKWKQIKSLALFLLEKFSLILTQNKETKIFMEELGVKNSIITGNLKFIAGNFNFNQEDLDKLKIQTEERIIVMAASTHPGEEEIFIQIHNNLKTKYPQLLTLIAPRHPSRSEEVKKILKHNNINYITRSSKNDISKKTEIMLIDTLGEFGLFYHLTNIVAVGGSWNKVGHNFIEPANLGNIIIFGPKMDNSREVSDYFIERNAALNANNAEEIEKIIIKYIQNPKDFLKIQENAKEIVTEMNQVKNTIMNYIQPYINNLLVGD